MTTIGVDEAETHFSQLLDRVTRGETITITRHGVPIAVLAPPPDSDKPDVRAAIEGFRELRKKQTLGGIPIRELIEEGRRY